jgi:hypothetical protein
MSSPRGIPVPGETTREPDDIRSWLLVDGELEPFVNQGDAAPSPATGNFTDGPYVHSIDADGRILFQASTNSEADNFFLAKDGSDIELVGKVDELPAPFATPRFSLARLSNAGALTLVSDGYAVGSDLLEKSMWHGKPDSLELLARSAEAPEGAEGGEASPGGPHVLWDLEALSVSQSGEWLAVKGRLDIYSPPALWVGPPDELNEILWESEPVPGLPDVRCTSIDEAQINEHGQVVVFTQTTAGHAVFRYDPRLGLELLAADLLPIIIDGVSESGYSSYRDGDAIAEDGSVYLVAKRRAEGVSSWKLMRSDPLASVDKGDGDGDGGASGAGTDDNAAGGTQSAAGAPASAGGASDELTGGEGGTPVEPTAEPGKNKPRSGGCNLGYPAPSRPASAWPLLLTGLLWLRKRRASLTSSAAAKAR